MVAIQKSIFVSCFFFIYYYYYFILGSQSVSIFLSLVQEMGCRRTRCPQRLVNCEVLLTFKAQFVVTPAPDIAG